VIHAREQPLPLDTRSGVSARVADRPPQARARRPTARVRRPAASSWPSPDRVALARRGAGPWTFSDCASVCGGPESPGSGWAGAGTPWPCACRIRRPGCTWLLLPAHCPRGLEAHPPLPRTGSAACRSCVGHRPGPAGSKPMRAGRGFPDALVLGPGSLAEGTARSSPGRAAGGAARRQGASPPLRLDQSKPPASGASILPSPLTNLARTAGRIASAHCCWQRGLTWAGPSSLPAGCPKPE